MKENVGFDDMINCIRLPKRRSVRLMTKGEAETLAAIRRMQNENKPQ